MNQREKLLAGGLATVVGLWQASVQFDNWVRAPVADRQAEIEARQERISKKEIELAKAQTAQRQYKNWKLRSLPPDPVNAISLYQNWLVELAHKAKLTNVSVTTRPAEARSSLAAVRRGTDARTKDDVYSMVAADLKAQGNLAQIREFLVEFRNSRLLHRVARARLTSKEGTGEPVMEVEFTVEGLSLREAPERSTLFSDPKLAELVPETSTLDKQLLELIGEKKLFVRGYNGPPKPPGDPRPRTTTPEEDPRQFVRLTSTFSNGGDYDATLYDPTTNKTARLHAGGEFNLAGVEGKVVSVSIDGVVLEIKGERFRLDIGRTLNQLEKLPSAG